MNPTIGILRKLIGLALLLISIGIIFRFDDVKGGFLLDKNDYEMASGVVISSQYERNRRHSFDVVYKYIVKGNDEFVLLVIIVCLLIGVVILFTFLKLKKMKAKLESNQ